jgi:HEAT repeat protein
MKDKAGLAEPLVILCINHPWRTLADAAINAVVENSYRSDATVDALLKVITQAARTDWSHSWYDPRTPAAHLSALAALKSLKPKRAAPTLLALLGNKRSFDVRRSLALAQALAATGEKRAIPALIAKLKDTSTMSTWSFNNVKITIARSDPSLLALVELTGQGTGSYGFVTHDQRGMAHEQTIFGFPDKKARTKAIQKFKDWWTKHKDKPPYKGLQPLLVPDLPEAAPSQPQTRW